MPVAPLAPGAALGAGMAVPLEVVEQEPSYIYCPNAVWQVPAHYIVGDLNKPVPIKPRQWRDASLQHAQFTAAVFLRDIELTTGNIVVLDNGAGDGPVYTSDGKVLESRVCWFLRLSIDGGAASFEHQFGDNFLWQLPHGVCHKIMVELDNHYAQMLKVDPTFQFDDPLLGRWAVTQHDFNANEWPDTFKVSHIRDYYDQTFVMSVMPCRGPLPSIMENNPKMYFCHKRPAALQPACMKKGAIDFTTINDDVCSHILKFAAARYMKAETAGDWNAFLAMRAVCKGWRDDTSKYAVDFVRCSISKVRTALKDGEVNLLMAARNHVLFNSNLRTIALVQDAHKLNVYNLMRLRAVKKPRSKPPTAKEVRERAERKRLNVMQSDKNEGQKAAKCLRAGERFCNSVQIVR